MSAQPASVLSNNLAASLANDTHLARKPQTFWDMALRSIRQDKLTLTAITVIVLLGLLALCAPLITPLSPDTTNTDNTFAPPYIWPYIQWRMGTDPTTAPLMLGQSGGVPHWLGTDHLGRDQMARLLYGGRISIGIALMAAVIAMLLGATLGGLAGYFGGIVDDIFLWFINTITSVPTIYLLIIVCAIFKPSPRTLVIFLGFLGWFGTARFMRGNVLRVKQLDYALSARAVGATNLRILFQHIIPNSIAVIVVVTALDVGALILTESVLSFLGLGVQPPTATWGNMLSRTRNFFFMIDPVTGKNMALHLMFPPGILIWLSVLCFYLIGDGLRDALDPMLKNKR